MGSMVAATLVLGIILFASGPISLYLSYQKDFPLFLVGFFSLMSIFSGFYWSRFPSGARWIGLIAIGLGILSFCRRINF